MSRLKVLEAITPSKIGGAEVFVAEFCEKLPQMGADYKLFIPSGRPFIEYARKRGINSINWKAHGKFDPLTVIRLARILKKCNCDVIHTHLSTASLLGAFAAKLAGKPSVAHVHGLNTATCFFFSSAVIAVSNAVKKHLAAQGIDEKIIYVVHNGVDIPRFEAVDISCAKEAQGINPDTPVFGVFGRLSPEKGQRVALEGMFLLLKTHPNARLLLTGDGKDRESLVESAKALGIERNVEFKGFADDVRGLMSACDAVIVPSLKEGFGLAAVEAMALERPVVASNIGGLPEIVVPDGTGFLFEPGNPQALASALAQLVENPDLARKMGKLGRDRVKDYFDADKQAKEVLHILQSVK